MAEVAKQRPTFATVQSQEEFFAILEAGVAAKKIPQQLLLAFKDFYNNYKSTCRTALPLSISSVHEWGICRLLEVSLPSDEHGQLFGSTAIASGKQHLAVHVQLPCWAVGFKEQMRSAWHKLWEP